MTNERRWRFVDGGRLKEICKLGQGKAVCRYLGVGPGGWVCLKGDLGVARMIDARVEAGTFNARGDNCDGD